MCSLFALKVCLVCVFFVFVSGLSSIITASIYVFHVLFYKGIHVFGSMSKYFLPVSRWSSCLHRLWQLFLMHCCIDFLYLNLSIALSHVLLGSAPGFLSAALVPRSLRWIVSSFMVDLLVSCPGLSSVAPLWLHVLAPPDIL